MIGEKLQMINMGDTTPNKGRLKLFELKMESSQQQPNWIPRSNSLRGRANIGAPSSHGSERFSKPSKNSQQKLVENDILSVKKCKVRDLNKISNVVFTLPEIKAGPLLAVETEQSQLVPYEQEKVSSYYSCKLQPSLQQKTNKSISSRYYRQIQVLKQMREPIVSQRQFTILNIHNQGLEETKPQGSAALLAAKARQKKVVFPSSAMERYQVVRDKEEIIVPLELQTKGFTQRKVSVSQKKVKPQLNLIKNRRLSKAQLINTEFKLSGWEMISSPHYDY